MKKLIMSLIATVLVAFGAAAQNVTFDEVCKKIAEHPNMTGDFSQEKLLKNAKKPMKSNGTFIFSSDGLMWNTLKPFPSSLIVTKTSIIQKNSSGKESKTDASKNQVFGNVSSMLSAIFNGNVEELNKSFNVEFSATGSNWKTNLTPKDDMIAKVLKKLEISGTCADTADIKKMIMTESSGSATTYNFLNVKYPQELSADEKNYFTK